MAALVEGVRVAPEDVIELTGTAVEVEAINAFINTAHRYVQRNLTGVNLDEGTLTEIEQYLAAHFLTLRDPRIKSEDIAGEYRVSYQIGGDGEGLAATMYGQTAVALDTTGTLGRLNLKRASFKVF
jgi:hypothetical protein